VGEAKICSLARSQYVEINENEISKSMASSQRAVSPFKAADRPAAKASDPAAEFF
jgi:hypothetical protein